MKNTFSFLLFLGLSFSTLVVNGQAVDSTGLDKLAGRSGRIQALMPQPQTVAAGTICGMSIVHKAIIETYVENHSNDVMNTYVNFIVPVASCNGSDVIGITGTLWAVGKYGTHPKGWVSGNNSWEGFTIIPLCPAGYTTRSGNDTFGPFYGEKDLDPYVCVKN